VRRDRAISLEITDSDFASRRRFRIDAVADATGLRAQLRRIAVPGDAIAPMARDAVTIRRLIDPNPREVTEADATRIYRAVLARARLAHVSITKFSLPPLRRSLLT
jgi:alcohol dehydrogenase class IV